MESARTQKWPAVLAVAALCLLLLEARLALQRWLQLQRLEQRTPSAPPAVRLPAPPPRGAKPKAAGADRDTRSARQRFRQGLTDPAFLRPLALLQRQMILSHYRSLFRILELSPERQESFAALLARKQIEKTEAESAAYDQGLYGTGMVIPAISEAQRDVNGEIERLLGPDGFRAYRDFEMTDGIRSVVTRLQSELEYTSDPLSDSSAEALIGLLNEATPPERRGGVTQFTGSSAEVAAGLSPAQYGAALPAAAASIAASRLTAAQLAPWRALLAEQQDLLRLRSLTLPTLRPPDTAGRTPPEP